MTHAILLSGSREWRDRATLIRVLAEVPEGSIFIHGKCAGLDLMAADILRPRGFEVSIPYPSQLGPRGGPARNALMVHTPVGVSRDRLQDASLRLPDPDEPES